MRTESSLDLLLSNLSPADGEANVQTIADAMRQCHERPGKKRILLSPGTYPFRNPASVRLFEALLQGELDPRDEALWKRNRNPLFDCADVHDIEIDGQGALLVFEGLMQPFCFIGCNGVTIRNVAIDWVRPAYTVGTVTAIAGGTYVVETHPDYPVYDKAPVVAVHEHDPSWGHLTGVCLYDNSAVEWLGPESIRLRHPQADTLTVGNTVFIRHIYAYAPAIQLYQCADVHIQDVTLYANPGMGVIGHLSRDIRLNHFHVKPAAGRTMSINVDATHFISCSGTIQLENCFFAGMGDDAANIHSFYLKVREVEDSRTVLAHVDVVPQDFYPERVFTGDEVEFVRLDTLSPYHTNRVDSVEAVADDLFRLQLKEPLPDILRGDDLIANTSRLARFIFRECHVKDIRGRGVLIQTRDALVENCLFEYCTGQGIHIDTATGWWESGATRDVSIRNNRFLHCGYGIGTYCDAAGIVVGTECEKPAVGVHRGIEIMNNHVEGTGDKPGLIVTMAEDVVIQGNTFRNCTPSAQFDHTGNVRLKDNVPPIAIP